jgi:DNA repair protein RecN (Recombination protein N)
MLTHLTIKNYALIKSLEMKPSRQLNVVTGETGAGKSIMLGALGLLLGNRADTKVLWDTTEKCITEGIFDISSYGLNDLFEEENVDYETLTSIRREISPTGKSRAFINDTPVTLDVMRKIGSRLMDIHSQHETLELGNRIFQLHLIDAYAGNHSIKQEYQSAWNNYVQSKKEYERLEGESAQLTQEADFVNFQLDELVKAGLQEKELQELEAGLQLLEHAEDIKMRFHRIVEQASESEFPIQKSLSDVRTQLQAIASYSEVYAELAARLESVRLEFDDIIHEVKREEQQVEFDPQKIEQVKERLSLIYQLFQKHRVKTISALLELQHSLQQKADKTLNLDALLDASKAALEKASELVNQKALQLSKSRQKVFTPLSKQLHQLIKGLGIPDAVFTIEHTSVQPGADGNDMLELLFSANKGIPPRPLAHVASGGEFSRLMFCVKYLMAEKTKLPTLILDEIDNGVSGEIALQLGKMMKIMARDHQIITITHLPQIAAKGDTHYSVYKDNSADKTVSLIKELNETERVTEIAQMIGGVKPSTLALQNARELIES